MKVLEGPARPNRLPPATSSWCARHGRRTTTPSRSSTAATTARSQATCGGSSATAVTRRRWRRRPSSPHCAVSARPSPRSSSSRGSTRSHETRRSTIIGAAGRVEEISFDTGGGGGRLRRHRIRHSRRFGVRDGALRRTSAAALDELSETQRRIIVLRELEGLSYREIADADGAQPGGCRERALSSAPQAPRTSTSRCDSGRRCAHIRSLMARAGGGARVRARPPPARAPRTALLVLSPPRARARRASRPRGSRRAMAFLPLPAFLRRLSPGLIATAVSDARDAAAALNTPLPRPSAEACTRRAVVAAAAIAIGGGGATLGGAGPLALDSGQRSVKRRVRPPTASSGQPAGPGRRRRPAHRRRTPVASGGATPGSRSAEAPADRGRRPRPSLPPPARVPVSASAPSECAGDAEGTPSACRADTRRRTRRLPGSCAIVAAEPAAPAALPRVPSVPAAAPDLPRLPRHRGEGRPPDRGDSPSRLGCRRCPDRSDAARPREYPGPHGRGNCGIEPRGRLVHRVAHGHEPLLDGRLLLGSSTPIWWMR